MDNPEVPTIEWFFGYGGNHLGLKRVIPGLRLIAACEIEAFVCANMVSKMEAGLLDAAPCWTDCRTFPAEQFKNRIALFIASYPCPGESVAGKRRGQDDPRWLWPHVRRFEQTVRPLWVFFENVRGHVSLGLSTVLSDLREDGYRTEWGIFSAAECGAPHNRERVFILGRLADSECGRWGERPEATGWQTRDTFDGVRSIGGPKDMADSNIPSSTRLGKIGGENRSNTETGLRSGSSKCGGDVSDTIGKGLERRTSERENHVGQCTATQRVCSKWPSRPGEPQYPWEPPRVVKGKERFRLKHDGPFQYMPDAKKLAYPSRLHGTGSGRELRGRRRICEAGQAVEHAESRGCRILRDAAQPGNCGYTDGTDEAMGDATERQDDRRRSRDMAETEGFGGCLDHAADGTGEDMGDSENPDGGTGECGEKERIGEEEERRRGPSESDNGETESPLGRDSDGCSYRLDHAELYESCDNRTDELRMLGNGVNPDTAERAFIILYARFQENAL